MSHSEVDSRPGYKYLWHAVQRFGPASGVLVVRGGLYKLVTFW